MNGGLSPGHKYRCRECGTLNVPPEGRQFQSMTFCDVKCYRTWYKRQKGFTR